MSHEYPYHGVFTRFLVCARAVGIILTLSASHPNVWFTTHRNLRWQLPLVPLWDYHTMMVHCSNTVSTGAFCETIIVRNRDWEAWGVTLFSTILYCMYNVVVVVVVIIVVVVVDVVVEIPFNSIRFAEDILICANTPHELQQTLQ